MVTWNIFERDRYSVMVALAVGAVAFIVSAWTGNLNIGIVGVLIGIGIFVVVQLIKIADRKQFKADITNWIKDGIKEALKEEAKDAIRDGIKEALKEDREGDGKD